MKAPEFWNIPDGPLSKPLLRTVLSPLGRVMAWATARRIKTATPYDPRIPVICVGNATMGGTGKTPVAIYLLKSLRRMGLNVVGLTRGYGGREKGPIPVKSDHTSVDVGDEPLLLARHAPVWVAAGRDDGARAAMSYGAQAIIMDDGHQNPLVEKTLSLMVVDAETGFGNGCVFPAGPLRENLDASLARADAIILMKPSQDYEISERLRAQLKGHVIIPAFLSPDSPPPSGKLYAFAGIGRPEKFFNSLARAGGNVIDTESYADHYAYKDEDVEYLFRMASEDGAALITTEKDYVRLPKGYRRGITPWPVSVQFEDELTLRRLLHPVIERAKRV